MNGKCTLDHSLDEWLELVTSCGKIGLTDAVEWHENGKSIVFTMLLADFIKEFVRYQNHLEKQ